MKFVSQICHVTTVKCVVVQADNYCMKMNWPLFLITLIFLLYNYKGFFTSYLTPVITLIFWRSQSSVPSFTFVLHLLFRVEKACESVNKAVWGITASQRVALRATCCRAFNLSLHIGFLLWDVPTSLCLSLFCPPPFFLSSRLSPHLLPHASQTRTYHTGFFFLFVRHDHQHCFK